MKRQATGWEKIFADNLFQNVLPSRIYKELSKLNSKRNQTIQLESEQTFHQRGHTDGKQAREKTFKHHYLLGKCKLKP